MVLIKPLKTNAFSKKLEKSRANRKQMKDFFKRYVAGAEALPIQDFMAEMGITYQERGTITELSPFGFALDESGITFDFAKSMIKILESGIDPFGKDVLGLKGGDLLYKWQGKEINMQTIQGVLGQYMGTAKEGLELSVTVLRKNDAGEYEEKELKGTLRKVPVEVSHALQVNENATPEQLKLRKAWLGDYKEK